MALSVRPVHLKHWDKHRVVFCKYLIFSRLCPKLSEIVRNWQRFPFTFLAILLANRYIKVLEWGYLWSTFYRVVLYFESNLSRTRVDAEWMQSRRRVEAESKESRSGVEKNCDFTVILPLVLQEQHQLLVINLVESLIVY